MAFFKRKRSTDRQTHPLALPPPKEVLLLPRARARAQDGLGLLLVLYSLATLAWMFWRVLPALEAMTP